MYLYITIKTFRLLLSQSQKIDLEVAGVGPLSSLIQTIPCIYHGFCEPKIIRKLMNKSEFLLLPSVEDHWGLVVHEAILSGAIPIVSNTVGASVDLIPSKYSFLVFNSGDKKSFSHSIMKVLSLSEAEKEPIRSELIEFSRDRNPEKWSEIFHEIVTQIR